MTLALSIVTCVLATAANAGVVELSPQNGVLGEAWTFSNGPEFPGAEGALHCDDGGILHLEYNFAKGGAYVAAYRSIQPPQAIGAVSFRVKKTAEAQITVRATANDIQTFQKSILFEHADWQNLRFDTAAWSGHYGGPNDGVLRQPLQRIGILVEGRGLEDPEGEVLIADVKAETQTATGGEKAMNDRLDGLYVVTDFGNGEGFGASQHGRLSDGVWSVDLGQTDSAALTHSLSLLGKPIEISLTVRSKVKGPALRMRMGSHFQTFERELGTLEGGEQTFTCPTPPEGWSYFGGENDGVARNPLRLTALTLERRDAPHETAEIELVALKCRTEVRRHDAVVMLAAVDGGQAVCTAWNLMNEPVTGTLSYRVRDWEEEVLAEESVEWALPANGIKTQRAYPLSLPDGLNFVDGEFRFKAPGVRDNKALTSLTRPVEDPGDATLRPELPWGMGVYLYRYGDSPAGYAEMDRAAAMAQAAGVKWSREEFSWARMEPARGEFDFHFYDEVVDAARRHGISVYGLLAYWSSWTEPYTEEGIDDFCLWARACVAHYKDRVKHWEIYNEPNIFFWSGPKELYPLLVKKCYAAIKEEDPEAQVLAISTAGIDTNFITQCVESEAPFDILTVHPYRPTLSERSFLRELGNAADLVGGRPVWITEMGWSTQEGGTDEREQAVLLARSYLGSALSGVCGSVSWYDFRNDGTDPFYNESNFGVLYRDMTPKPAYRALATVCRTLASGRPTRRGDFGDTVYALEMGGALALWTSREAVEIACRERDGAAVVRNLMGETLAVKRAPESLTITLRPRCPVVITGAALEPIGVKEVPAAKLTPAVVEF